MAETHTQSAVACPDCRSHNTHPGSTPEAPRFCRACDNVFHAA